MKKLVVLFLSLSIFLLSGCSMLTLSKETEYTLDNENIKFTLPNAWELLTNDSNDLTLSKTSAELGITVFKKVDMEVDSAEELLNYLIKDKMVEMTDFSLLKKYNTNKTKDRIIYSSLYTASKDGYEKQYFFNVVDFIGSDTYVFALYEAKETYMKYNIDDIQRILIRMKWNGELKDLAMN